MNFLNKINVFYIADIKQLSFQYNFSIEGHI